MNHASPIECAAPGWDASGVMIGRIAKTLASELEIIDRHLANKDGRAAYEALMAVFSTYETPGMHRDGAELFMRLADLYAQGNDFTTTLKAWTDAIHCPGAIGNERLHLRLGKAQLELGDETRAADELCRAFMGGGREIFDGEDPKYFAFLKTKITGGRELVKVFGPSRVGFGGVVMTEIDVPRAPSTCYRCGVLESVDIASAGKESGCSTS